MNNSIRYTYICSAGHSGSTLLDLLLGSHSQVESLGEIIHLSKNISLNTACACGVPIRSCYLWKRVAEMLNRQLGIDVFEQPYALHMGFPDPQNVKDRIHTTLGYRMKRKWLRGLHYLDLKYDFHLPAPLLSSIHKGIENTFLVYEAVRKVSEKQMIVDSSKSYPEGIAIYKKNPGSTRIIQLSRDGRAVFYSYLKRNFPRSKSLRGWRNHYARALPLLTKHVQRNHLYHMKYEELAGNPRRELERLCDFLDLGFEEDMLKFADRIHHITNGNNMRFRKSSEIRADEAWKRQLSEADHALFSRKAGDLNRRLGYA